MKIYSVEEVKANFSKLVDLAANGEPFLVAIDGRPAVKFSAFSAEPSSKVRKFGTLRGQFRVPDNIDTEFESEIAEQFYASSEAAITESKK